MTKLGQKLVDQWDHSGYHQQNDDRGYKFLPITFPYNLLLSLTAGYVDSTASDYRYNYYSSYMRDENWASKYTVTGFRISRVNNTIDQWNYTVYAYVLVAGY